MIDLKEQAGVAMNIRSQLGEPISNPQVTLAALAFADDLGRLLWRMKYGQDIKRSGLQRATLLLANRVRLSGKFARRRFTGLTHEEQRARRATHKSDAQKRDAVKRAVSDIVDRFAQRVIIEWVADLCPHCDGRGIMGRSAPRCAPLVAATVCPTCAGERSVVVSEERIPFAHNGRGPIVYREYERCGTCYGDGLVRTEQTAKPDGRQICAHCNGTGRHAVDDAARALALGVPLDVYRTHWAKHFRVLLALLDKVDASANDTVRAKVRR